MRLLLPLLLIAACKASIRPPELGGIYNRSAQYHGADRNPVVVIPGVLGSRLEGGGDLVWGAFGGGSVNPGTPDGARRLALPMREGAPLAELVDEVGSTGALDRLRITFLGLPVSLSAYAEVLLTLGAGGYRDEELGMAGAVDYGDDHFTCFQFHYDWRRDNVENARRLHAFLVEKKAYVEQKLRENGAADPDVRFDVVAHSMGGLLARYVMRYGDADLPVDGAAPDITWKGCALIERAILVATPNAGSAEAIVNLRDGTDLAFFLPRYESALLGTFPSLYQLLPRGRHGALVDGEAVLDPLDPALWEARGWGLADPDQDEVLQVLLPNAADAAARRRTALDHQRKCLARAAAFHRALDAKARPPAGSSLTLFAGDAVPTLATVNARNAKDNAYAPGDGTVTRQSALMDERAGRDWTPWLDSPIAWRQVTFLFQDHIGLTKSEEFSDNVLFLLLEEPRR